MIPLLLALAGPALSCGWYGVLDDDTGAVLSADMRVVFVPGEGQTTAVVQSGVMTTASRFAWLLPVPGAIVDDRVVKIEPEVLGALIGDTDPRYERSVSCAWAPLGMYGCKAMESAGDTGGGSIELLRELDVGPYEVAILDADLSADVTGWLSERGYRVPGELEPMVDSYLAEGWVFLAIALDAALDAEELPDESVALPALAFTYASDRVVAPLRIGQGSSLDQVETLVLTVGPPMAPAEDPYVLPTAATAFATPSAWESDFADWYRGVAQAAAAELPGRGWVLEHATTGTGVAGPLIDALRDQDLLAPSTATHGVTVSRYRAWLSAEDMDRDLDLAVAPDLPEVTVVLGTRVAALLPVGMLAWLLRRRRSPLCSRRIS